MQNKWELPTLKQVVIVLLAFSLAGPTVLIIRKPILIFLVGGMEMEWWMNALYIIFILPIYNIILLFYGFLLGQFDFFWNYEKRSLAKIKNIPGKIYRRFFARRNAQEE